MKSIRCQTAAFGRSLAFRHTVLLGFLLALPVWAGPSLAGARTTTMEDWANDRANSTSFSSSLLNALQPRLAWAVDDGFSAGDIDDGHSGGGGSGEGHGGSGGGSGSGSGGSGGGSGNSGSGGGSSGSGSSGSSGGSGGGGSGSSGSGGGSDDRGHEGGGSGGSGSMGGGSGSSGSGGGGHEGEGSGNSGPGSANSGQGNQRNDRVRIEEEARRLINGFEAEFKVRFEVRPDRLKFQAEIEDLNLPDGTALAICSNGQQIGSALLANHFAELELDSRHDMTPSLRTGDTVELRQGSCDASSPLLMTAVIGGGGLTMPQGDQTEREAEGERIINGFEAELNVRFEQRADRNKFEVEVENLNLPPNTVLDVCLNGQSVGTLQLDAFHSGELELEQRNGGNVPFIRPGDTVTIAMGGCSNPPLLTSVFGGSLTATAASRQLLQGENRALVNGFEAEFDVRFERLMDRVRFTAEVQNLNLPDTPLSVCRAGVLLGTVTVGQMSRAELELDSRRGDSIPAINAGDVIQLRVGPCTDTSPPLLSASVGAQPQAPAVAENQRLEARARRMLNGFQAELNVRLEQRADRTRFRVEVENLNMPAGSLQVCLNGQPIGSLMLESSSGELELDSRQSGALSLIKAGDVVQVTQGSCSDPSSALLSVTLGNGMTVLPGAEGVRAQLEGKAAQVIGGFQAELHAVFEQRLDRTRLRVEVEDLNMQTGTTLNVCLNGQLLGSVSLNAFHFAELELDSRQGDTVPMVRPGDMVAVTTGACSGSALLVASINGGAAAGAVGQPADAVVLALGRDRALINGFRAEFNVRFQQLADRRKLRVDVENLNVAMGTALNICSGQTLVGTIGINRRPVNEVELDSRMGATMPLLQPGNAISLQTGACTDSTPPMLKAILMGASL